MRPRTSLTTLFLGLSLLVATAATAQQVTPPTPQFDSLGFIQEATLDAAGAICRATSPLLAGGTLTLNGIQMIVPCNTILQLPAASMTWAQLFDPANAAAVSAISAPPAQGAGQTGLALADLPAPFPSFEVHVQGNVVPDPITGAPRYIVGLIVPVTQQGLNGGSGRISYIDYATGTFRVGGIPNDPSCVATALGGGPTCSGALVQFNDPTGRFGLVHSPDSRFTVDSNNPTIHATTGMPVCIPRVAPPATDAECPMSGGVANTGNRPRNGDPRFPVDPFLATGAPLTKFDMPAPVNGQFPDARRQVPLMVGDWVDYSGTLYKINQAGASDRANTYISAHTVNANLGVFTAPGVPPAYIGVEEILIGTGGNPLPNLLQEATTRLTVVGFTTDPTRFVDVSAIDVNPCTGEETLRPLVSIDPATQPMRGRFVLRLLGGLFMPPTREYVITSQTGVTPNVANGLTGGAYRLPNFDFIAPENHAIGDPIIPFNFQDIPFLAQGSGPLGGTGPVVGQLDPWPGAPAPARAACTANGVAPLVSAGANFTAASGSQVTLTGTMTLDPNSTSAQITWVQTAGPGVALAGNNTLTPRFTAPTLAPGALPVTLTFRLTVTDQFGTANASVSVTVTSPTDIVAITAASWKAGSLINGVRQAPKLTLAATSSNPAAVVTAEMVRFTDGVVVRLGTMLNDPPGTYNMNVNGSARPRTVTVRSSSGGTATVTCGAPDANGRATCQ